MKKYLFTFLMLTIIACYKDNDFSPSKLPDIISLNIQNNNALADGVDQIQVITVFPPDLNTEDDSKVIFLISDQGEEVEIIRDIELVNYNGQDQKIADLLIKSNEIKSLKIEAKISINQTQVSKTTEISFQKAFPEDIVVLATPLKIIPDSSFSEINITTNLTRTIGLVSRNTLAKTVVVDTVGKERGLFVNYQNKTDSTGSIKNSFTLGLDPYLGKLLAISETINESGKLEKDTIIIFSEKK